ncbi:hypothetical protein ACFWMS_24685 [Peribacillus butanolivorans]|uniref:Uncharacterized protein n=1 Tax=Peribacillus butanolivorans TaxID=421767 RepID=A0ABM6XHA1_9BACI|nr:hypothetical protein [Peribacillus butanolivorans]AXN37787.1 hypothetical protein DTO10_04715 [Peribacillus butanolivorans]
MSNNQKLFFVLILIPLIIALVFVFNTDFLIPAGFVLGVDGVVVSRNLYVIFILYLITKVIFQFTGSKKD